MRAGSIAGGMGPLVYALCLLPVGGILTVGGTRLISLGGSIYYLAAGIAVFAVSIALLVGRTRLAALLYLGMFGVTIVWAVLEAGLDGWALAPRILSPFVLGVPFLLVGLIRGPRVDRLAGVLVLVVAALLIGGIWITSGFRPAAAERRNVVRLAQSEDWAHFGNTPAGTFFSPLTQINRSNVARLKQVWSVPLGPMPSYPYSQTETVPLNIGDRLFVCDAFSNVIAMDPETGRTLWRYEANPNVAQMFDTKCRGVAYYAVPGASGTCAQRVYVGRVDGKLVALDAESGRPCLGFGVNGTADLLKGLTQRNPGYYRITSAPTVAGGRIVVGGSVADGQYAGEPSGVVRAYDAVTGQVSWAWDIGRPGQHGEPGPGQYYTPGTPNVWAPMSADDSLGLLYVPTGNSTPDYYGGHRSPESNRYSSSLVALDATTGEPRWSFQTTHYDVWDYDVASQPILFELRVRGRAIPAVLQPTKRGEIFVFDRRTGRPIYPVVERRVPQSGAVERLSPTQPYSPGLPTLKGPRVTERSMWGLTAIDQLWCRIAFRESRYDGPLTPPGLTPSIADPGSTGGVNWGGATIDPTRQIAIITSNRLATRVRLVPRTDPMARALKASSMSNTGGPVAQEGTPFAADIVQGFLSPLKIPCQAPPHGKINAVDLVSGRLIWSRPLGSARDLGPMRTAWHIPFTIGTPLFGGTMSTAAGLTFVGASQDHAFRAFDSETGELLFEADLPDKSVTRPMTFRSRKSGRQIVVIASEAPYRVGKAHGALTAFALP